MANLSECRFEKVAGARAGNLPGGVEQRTLSARNAPIHDTPLPEGDLTLIACKR